MHEGAHRAPPTGNVPLWLSRGPLFPLAALGGLDLDAGPADLVPVGAEGGAAALLVALEHGAAGVLVGVGVELLEELVDGGVAADVRVVLRGGRGVGGEQGGGERVPVFARPAGGGDGGGGGR